MPLSDFTVKDLRAVVKKYKLETHIGDTSKMKKAELVNAMEKHLRYDGKNIHIKQNTKNITGKPIIKKIFK